jgi:hypothetical protein
MTWAEAWSHDQQPAAGAGVRRAGTGESGQLQSFEQRFERMTAWQARRDPAAPREENERQTLEYTASMPAWRGHPRVAARDG